MIQGFSTDDLAGLKQLYHVVTLPLDRGLPSRAPSHEQSWSPQSELTLAGLTSSLPVK